MFKNITHKFYKLGEENESIVVSNEGALQNWREKVEPFLRKLSPNLFLVLWFSSAARKKCQIFWFWQIKTSTQFGASWLILVWWRCMLVALKEDVGCCLHMLKLYMIFFVENGRIDEYKLNEIIWAFFLRVKF